MNKETMILTADKRMLTGNVLFWNVQGGEVKAQVQLKHGNWVDGETIRIIDVLREFDLKKDLCTVQQANGHKK